MFNNTLDFIKMQREKGLDDYAILQATKMMNSSLIKNTINKIKGGNCIKLTPDQKSTVLEKLKSIDKNKYSEIYHKLDTAANSPEGYINDYNSFSEVETALNKMSETIPVATVAEGKTQSEETMSMSVEGETLSKKEKMPTQKKTPSEEAVGPAPAEWETTAKKKEIPTSEEETPSKKKENPPKKETSKANVEIFTTLTEGTTLFHPSQNIKRFGDSMIFVDLPSALDLSKPRSFVMFYTPNEEYARRFSGMWSLNKRPVFVHKLSVKTPVDKIRIIDPNIIPDNIENTELAKGMCGTSIDGYINGIKFRIHLAIKNLSMNIIYAILMHFLNMKKLGCNLVLLNG